VFSLLRLPHLQPLQNHYNGFGTTVN